jgi:hypothetical protein
MNKPTESTPPKEPAVAGNFFAMLQHKTGGVMLPDLDHALAELVQQVRDTGKPGQLTYTIKIRRNAKRGIRVVDDLAVKAPKPEAGETFYFAADNGALLRNDPDQALLPLRVVTDETPAPASLKTAAS